METFILPPQKRKLFSICQGHVARNSIFPPNFESISFLFYLAYVHKNGISIYLSQLLQMCLCRILWNVFFWFQVCFCWLCSFLLFSLFVTLVFSDRPYHPASVTSSSPLPTAYQFISLLFFSNILPSSHFPPLPCPPAHLSAKKIDLIKNEKDYLREIAA